MTIRTVIAIGNFDGMHLGHRRIVLRAAELAREAGARTVAMTFYPSPASVLRPGMEPPRLMDREHKLAALTEAGADKVVILEPTPALLALTAEKFVAKTVAEYQPIAWVEGEDFRFGHNRAGDASLLQLLGDRFGFTAHVLGKVQVALSDQFTVPVSSSLIRWLLAHGRVCDAALCLGRPFSITGRVIAGERRGRTLGVPTANLDPSATHGRVIPADGVYAGTITPQNGRSFAAAISIGVKPTFGQHQHSIEAHLLGFEGDLYGRVIEIAFRRWVRDQQSFPGVEPLKRQLARDIAEAERRYAPWP